MTAVLIALALSATLAADVPFLPQTPDLCGGAAVAMVFRYWGDAHADVQQFAPLVDRDAGGIADRALVEAVRTRGWLAVAFTGSVDALGDHLEHRRPIIVLIHDRAQRYHYVVVTAIGTNGVTVHDPAWGPSRVIRMDEFERRWKAAKSWSLLIEPREQYVGSGFSRTSTEEEVRLKADATTAGSRVASGFSRTSTCETLLDAAIADVQQRGLQEADTILGRVRDECPASAGPLRELAGVRFAERRWSEAAALAREALEIDASDTYAIDVLGSSLFMLDDPVGALRAWNRIGKPRLDTVRIEGLRHTRYETVAAAVGVRPNTMLTPEAFALAERRVHALPDRMSDRLTLRPQADGYAAIDAAVAERAVLPRSRASWAGVGIGAAIDREVTASVHGFSGQGDVWSASWRWWERRPRVAIGVAKPRLGGFAGVWRVDASWERETFRVETSESPALVTESHMHGGLALSDWLTSNLRYSVAAGLDAWDSRRKAASVGTTIERRLLRDRVAVSADATSWLPFDESAAFHAVGARLRAHGDETRWSYASALGIERVSNTAPIGLWPGAGDGRARTPLLRAHPLLDGGIIDATSRSVFGRTLSYASAEVRRWLDRPGTVRIGVAAFADAAVARRTGSEGGKASNVDVGGGLRFKLPMTDRVLRIDVAHGLRDKAEAVTIGWLF